MNGKPFTFGEHVTFGKQVRQSNEQSLLINRGFSDWEAVKNVKRMDATMW